MAEQIHSFVEPAFVDDLLKPLLAFNTANPPGDEAAAAKFLCEWMSARGIETRYLEPSPGRGNALGIVRGKGGGPTIVLNWHTDTQPIGRGWTTDPLGCEVRGGRIYGRGTGDMKSGVSAMLAAGAAIAARPDRLAGNLILLASADETSGGYHGVGAVLDALSEFNADMAVVCEPTLGDVGVGNRGVVWIKAKIIGRGGQAGKSHTGVNAISVAAELITAIEREFPDSLSANPSKYVPNPSVGFGQISGGEKPNVIAEECTIIIDRRLTIGETENMVLDQMGEIANMVASARGASIDLTSELFVPAVEVDTTEPIVAECERALMEITGRTAKLRGLSGFTDAHFFVAGLNVPAVNFGPWYLTPHPRGSFSDIPDEYAHIDEVILGAKVYERLLLNILSGGTKP
ncbi:M20 family metallopeptidase [Pseudohalocynthiibacter aestuariivivens]|nr:M20 family metallopeptidase [Pseudohalocynthiibacter aestuariivivens]